MKLLDNNIQIIKTGLGNLKIQQDENFPNRITIFLNDIPIIMLDGEAPEHKGKFVLKRYKNNNIVNDDNYINKSVYQINEDELTPEIVGYILKSLEDNNNEKRNSRN